MFVHRLLYFCAHQVTVFAWQGGALTQDGSYEATAAGAQEFSGYLERHKKKVFAILANVSEENFHLETIPFLRGEDRQAIVTRKLGQLYFSASLTTALSLGHQKSRRKDERIMLVALTNNEAFAPWLAAFAQTETPLAGIYSLPLLAPLFLKRIGITEERCLLLTIQDQSIRQSYLDKGELQFSRLAPLHNSSIGGIAQTFAAEALKLQQYLVGQRILGRQEPIAVYLLAHANARKAIETSCEDSEMLSFFILDIDECARKCKQKKALADTRSELFFLQLLATSSGKGQFANDDHRHDYHLWLLRTVFEGLGALALFSCLLFSGKQVFDARLLNKEASSIQQETILARQHYQSIVNTFPPIPTSNETLRRVIKRYAELQNASGTPMTVYREISRALQTAEAIEIEGIEWRNSPVEAAKGTAPNPSSPGSELTLTQKETAVFRGTLSLGVNNNPRQILAVFNQFISTLKLNPKLQVEVLQQPFDIESAKSLKGGGDDALEAKQTRAFKVQINWTESG
ncbi:MAG TPA: hypothetical protein PKN13_02990 [Accumulibacter sp.]|nr:hypothetical protein [Accumulibacter sp.]HMW18835.1 hypothetical protein [Accumulibacter sp.]HMX23229.1 hypothetical protein [Accumulibacter sp.]HMY06480.1 hypothetical protein [Accumulibacter sp.]HNC16989.1 hypothetical protein [Accumulibacter sp.]